MMNYKDKTFEIGDNKIRFKNQIFGTLFIILIPVFSLFFFKKDLLSGLFSIVGSILAVFIIRLFTGIYLRNTIDLSDISYIKRQIWNKSIDKDRNFWGECRYKYHFPTGLNKKTNPEVIFVHLKKRKAAIGFVPENMEDVISVLKEVLKLLR